jgi:hypothetical protein
MAQTLQQQFEEAARIIMKELNRQLERSTLSYCRTEAIKDAKREMMALKDMYQGLIDKPIEDAQFAEVMKILS